MVEDAAGGQVAAGLPAQTHLGEVTLWVRDLDRQVEFYTNGIGLNVLADPGLPLGDGTPARSRAVLGQGHRALLVLEHRSDLLGAPLGSAGLFHTAFLFDSPAGLAAGLARALAHHPERFTGSADHHVSEAFYLDDPEGNGIEIYRDRPRDEWTWHDGLVTMTVNPLDPAAYLTAHGTPTGEGSPAAGEAIRIGHVHLRVGDIALARDFTTRGLGFDVTFAMGGSALFVSAGGYHHHLGLNTWHSRGAGPRPPALGLASVRLLLPDGASLADAAQRLTRAGWTPQQGDGAVSVTDPWGTRFLLSVESGDPR